MIDRGDIRWFRFEAPDKRRPVLVLGRGDVLPMLTQIPVIPISTQIRGLRWEVRLSAADGLPTDWDSRECSASWRLASSLATSRL